MEEKRSELKIEVNVSNDIYQLSLAERAELFAKAFNEMNESAVGAVVEGLVKNKAPFTVKVGVTLIPGNSVEGQNLIEQLERE